MNRIRVASTFSSRIVRSSRLASDVRCRVCVDGRPLDISRFGPVVADGNPHFDKQIEKRSRGRRGEAADSKASGHYHGHYVQS